LELEEKTRGESQDESVIGLRTENELFLHLFSLDGQLLVTFRKAGDSKALVFFRESWNDRESHPNLCSVCNAEDYTFSILVNYKVEAFFPRAGR
jgi:hypothetical protein